MESQYILVNNNSPETVAFKFEHCIAVQIGIGNKR